MRFFFIFFVALIAAGVPAAAQNAIYLIRHAEKESNAAEPALTLKGRERAANWAEMLQHVGLDGIITSDALRTRETGAIIGTALGLQPVALPRDDIAGLIDTLEFEHDEDTMLIVAHAETMPGILGSLGVTERVEIDQSEFANLFVLVGPASDSPVYLHLLMP